MLALKYKPTGFTIVELLIVIVVIAILAAIATVAYVGVSENARINSMKYDLSQWRRKAAFYQTERSMNNCPPNYSFVYGNSSFGTSDFCVMKYEAKNVGGVATSQATGAPWVSINQADAITASTAAGGHLITEAEWMTIAADVLSVRYNWSGWEVGAGLMYQGHVNSNPASALAASTDDWDRLNGITGGTGKATGLNSSRVLWLKSGDPLWDFSGNVWEWTQQAIGTPALTINQIGVSGDSAYNWREYNNSSLLYGNLPAVSRPSGLAGVSGLGAINAWDSTKGIGQLYANYADTGSRIFGRGGGWVTGVYGGVLALGISSLPSDLNSSRGFRVAR